MASHFKVVLDARERGLQLYFECAYYFPRMADGVCTK